MNSCSDFLAASCRRLPGEFRKPNEKRQHPNEPLAIVDIPHLNWFFASVTLFFNLCSVALCESLETGGHH